MNDNAPIGKLVLTYIMNTGVWCSNVAVLIKICYAIMVGFLTFLYIVNQWGILSERNKDTKIVIIINRVITYIPFFRKRDRHRHNSNSKPK